MIRFDRAELRWVPLLNEMVLKIFSTRTDMRSGVVKVKTAAAPNIASKNCRKSGSDCFAHGNAFCAEHTRIGISAWRKRGATCKKESKIVLPLCCRNEARGKYLYEMPQTAIALEVA